MSAKHRKASKLAAKRTAVAATAVGATAAVGLMGSPAQAATTPPDYTQAITDYSHALNNFLEAANSTSNSAGSVWNPIASPTGGVLPVFGSSYKLSDATKLTDLPDILINLGNLNLPTGVPGVVPNVVLPGGSQLDLSKILPTSMPGGSILVTAGNTLNDILELPVVSDVANTLPPVSELISGLEISQSKYTNGYNWGLLGLNGQTNVLNTFVQTPSGLTLNLSTIPGLGGVLGGLGGILGTDLSKLTIIQNGSLPQGTIWVPQADGTYKFPLGAKAGWWAAAPTAVLKLPATLGGSQTVVSVPIGATGAELPLGLLKAGMLGANVLLPTQNGVYSPIGLTMTNLNSGILPFGATNINVTTGNYLGTNGINVNNGQNLLLLQNPLGVPLPILYGLGGFNFGTSGAGLTSPSLFGIKLFSDNLLQVGTQTAANTPAGLIPEGILPADPLSQITSGVLSPLGVSSLTQILGLDAFIKPVMTAFGPVYQVISSATLQPLSDFATSQYGPFINNSASQLLDLSKTLDDQSSKLPGADSTQPVPTPAPAPSALAIAPLSAGVDNTSNPDNSATARHLPGPGMVSVQDLTKNNSTGDPQPQSDQTPAGTQEQQPIKNPGEQLRQGIQDTRDAIKDARNDLRNDIKGAFGHESDTKGNSTADKGLGSDAGDKGLGGNGGDAGGNAGGHEAPAA